MRRAASLLVLAAAAAQSPYSADQQQDFERTRQDLLARDPLAARLRDEHLHELPHWKDLDNLHHKVSYHLSTKLVARKPPSN